MISLITGPEQLHRYGVDAIVDLPSIPMIAPVAPTIDKGSIASVGTLFNDKSPSDNSSDKKPE